MNPDPSPLAIAAYAVGLVLAIPTLIAIVRLIYFIASAHSDLKKCVDGLDKLGTFKHDVRDTLQEHETRLTLVERDVEQLKDSAA